MTNNSPYAELSDWPNLGPITSVKAFNAPLAAKDALTVHRDMLTAAGLNLPTGVFVTRFQDRILFSLKKFCEGYRIGTKNERFTLCKDGLNLRIRSGSYTLAFGKEFLVMTTHSDAVVLTGQAQLAIEAEPSGPAELSLARQTTGYQTVNFISNLSAPREVSLNVRIREDGNIALGAEHLESCSLQGPLGFDIAIHKGSILLYTGSANKKGVFGLRSSARQFLVDTRGAELGDNPAVIRGDGYLFIADAANVSNLAPKLNFQNPSKVNHMATAAQSTVQNNATYDLTGGQSRIQVQGKWLRALGFIPGAKYRFDQAKGGKHLVAVLDKNGPHQVTTMSGETPKLYVPRAALAHLTSKRANIVGGNLNTPKSSVKFGFLTILNDGPLPGQAVAAAAEKFTFSANKATPVVTKVASRRVKTAVKPVAVKPAPAKPAAKATVKPVVAKPAVKVAVKAVAAKPTVKVIDFPNIMRSPAVIAATAAKTKATAVKTKAATKAIVAKVQAATKAPVAAAPVKATPAGKAAKGPVTIDALLAKRPVGRPRKVQVAVALPKRTAGSAANAVSAPSGKGAKAKPVRPLATTTVVAPKAKVGGLAKK